MSSRVWAVDVHVLVSESVSLGLRICRRSGHARFMGTALRCAQLSRSESAVVAITCMLGIEANLTVAVRKVEIRERA